MLIALAADFVSFLASKGYMERHRVRNAILYGSVVRGDFTDKSDIDIFIDIEGPADKAKAELKVLTEGFYSSVWFKKWVRFGVRNRISCLSGKLGEWKDLERSITANNLLLYGKYVTKLKGNPMSLFVVEGLRPESKRVFVARTLFGYKHYGKAYKGLVEKLGGVKLGKGCFLVPIGSTRDIVNFLRLRKADYKVRAVELSE